MAFPGMRISAFPQLYGKLPQKKSECEALQLYTPPPRPSSSLQSAHVIWHHFRACASQLSRSFTASYRKGSESLRHVLNATVHAIWYFRTCAAQFFRSFTASHRKGNLSPRQEAQASQLRATASEIALAATCSDFNVETTT
ncbi:hypothetical protein BaRGS_00027955 [Batillaria attramentaria]|uniref:Uncharacterized protein n=1 Tax=Batillaria attramentaria TaxID=370345 RepID=A0ABD0K0Y0_9CAEN